MTNFLMMFIALPLASAFTMLITYRLSRKLPDIISCAVSFYLAAAVLSIYLFSNVNTVNVVKIGDLPYGMSINLIMDGLSIFLLLIANVMAFLIIFYSVQYMEKYTGKEKFYTLIMLMMAGVNGVILTGDFFTLFIFMELASLSAAALVAFGKQVQSNLIRDAIVMQKECEARYGPSEHDQVEQ